MTGFMPTAIYRAFLAANAPETEAADAATVLALPNEIHTDLATLGGRISVLAGKVDVLDKRVTLMFGVLFATNIASLALLLLRGAFA